MVATAQLTTYLKELLECNRFVDYAPNGLQIEGKADIQILCTAVSASLEAIHQAIDQRADALLVHHGYFWKNEPSIITGMKQQRIKLLLQHNINLLAYHLPLDCHLTLGNNAQLAKLLEIKHPQANTINGIKDLLWIGNLAQDFSGNALAGFLTERLNRAPIHLKSGSNKPIRTIAWCSGGAQDYLSNAQELGADAFISGEVSERNYYEAQELDIHYFSCGHHATERYGVQALGQHLAKQFKLDHTYLECNNPI